jgi:hypothetical protein
LVRNSLDSFLQQQQEEEPEVPQQQQTQQQMNSTAALSGSQKRKRKKPNSLHEEEMQTAVSSTIKMVGSLLHHSMCQTKTFLPRDHGILSRTYFSDSITGRISSKCVFMFLIQIRQHCYP